MKNYGFPYKGSKNRLAEKIVKLFPDAENFYDLFCGGCAITHRALIENRWKNYVINDIDSRCPKLFLDAINGKFKDETRWISREDFFKLKDDDGYVAFCWSFGNDGSSYLYSKEKEPYRKALHYARVFDDFSLFEKMGIKLKSASRIEFGKNTKELKEKYIIWYVKEVLHSDYEIEEIRKDLTERIKKNSAELRQYLIDALKKSGLTQSEVDRRNGNQMSGHYFGKSQWQFPTREEYKKMQEFLPLEKDYDEIYGLQDLMQSLQSLQSLQSMQSLQSLQSLESLQRLQRLKSLESLQSLERLQRLCKSYDEIEIKKDSIIYCDIPYKGTDGYNGIDFDYEHFYSWCKKQTELCFISSYEMPEDFIPIAEFNHRSILSATKNKPVIEKVFIPKHQLELYKSRLFACI